MFNSLDSLSGVARIKVIGVGGAGNNAVNRMIEAGITSASYVAVNTDKQILLLSKAESKIQIGSTLTKGLGAGAEPEVAAPRRRRARKSSPRRSRIPTFSSSRRAWAAGTGTGAAPVIAKIARDLKILTIAVVTEPFTFEGKKRMDNTAKGLENLKKYVDTLIVIPNDKITGVVPKNTPMNEALRVADEVLKQGIRGIADLIVNPALINLDFADVRTILKDQGLAHMGVGVAKGENRIVEAVRLAVNSPLLETTIEGAKGVILNIVGGNDLTMDEVQTAATLVQSVVDYSANIIFGACIDSNINDEVEVTVIATGFPHADNYSVKEARNENRNFIVNRGMPTQGGAGGRDAFLRAHPHEQQRQQRAGAAPSAAVRPATVSAAPSAPAVRPAAVPGPAAVSAAPPAPAVRPAAVPGPAAAVRSAPAVRPAALSGSAAVSAALSAACPPRAACPQRRKGFADLPAAHVPQKVSRSRASAEPPVCTRRAAVFFFRVLSAGGGRRTPADRAGAAGCFPRAAVFGQEKREHGVGAPFLLGRELYE